MQKSAEQVAEFLLKIKAVKLSPAEPFTWASGILSPIYCDNRQTLSYPEIRASIRDAFCELIREKFPEVNGIAGVATAGVPHGVLVAERLSLPFIYVRSSAKGHGMRNLIEGRLHDQARFVVVEDLVSTGGSSFAAVQAVREAGAKVEGLISIFSYGFAKANHLFEEAGVPFHSLTDLETLLAKAVEINYIRPGDMETIRKWRSAPESWSPAALNN
jgi:orotate phosphoribosyltransferase